jgi:hypothetical protein
MSNYERRRQKALLKKRRKDKDKKKKQFRISGREAALYGRPR